MYISRFSRRNSTVFMEKSIGSFMRTGKLVLSLFIVLITLLSGCKKSKNQAQDVVATIDNDYNITIDDLQSFVMDWHLNRKYKTVDEAYHAALDAMIIRQMKRIDFFNLELYKDDILVSYLNRVINDELVTEYYNDQYVKKSSDLVHAKKVYELMDKKVTYQQILFEYPQDVTNEQIESIKETVKNVKLEIENGEDIKAALNQYSNELKNPVVSGQFTIDWEQAIANKIDESVINLQPGDVRVYYANDGIHLIRVTDIEKVKIEPFDKVKQNIIAKLEKLNTDKKYSDFEDDKKALIDESSLVWNETAINRLVDWANDPKFYTQSFQDQLQHNINKDNFTILTDNDGQVDLKEFLYLLNNVLTLRPPGNARVQKSDIKNYILEAMRTDMLAQKAKALGLEARIFNAKTKNPELQSQIVQLYDIAMIDSQIPKPTDDILHKFYDEQKDSLYYQLRKVNIYAMVYPDEMTANQVMQQISDGTPFEKISGRWLVKSFIRNRNGSIESYLSPEEPFLGKAAIDLNPGDVAGPIKYTDPEQGDLYAIIKCVQLRPEKQLYFDDVKNSIANDYINYQKAILRDKVTAQLEKKYSVVINDKVLSNHLHPKQ